MNKETLQNILQTSFDDAAWTTVLTEVFGAREMLRTPKPILLPANDIAQGAVELGSFATTDDRIVGLYKVNLNDKPRIWQNRVGLRSLLRSVYQNDVDAALVVFVQENKWRLSLISEIRTLDDSGNIVEQKTEPKRSTYLLGKSETVRTPVERLDSFTWSNRSIDSLIKAFSVEALNKDFFREYKAVFEAVEAEVRTQVETDETARLFAQRLLNRLMFLYFIQKKNWMEFDGESNYLRAIFDKAIDNKENFFRDRLYYVFFYGLSNNAESKEIHNQTELEAIRGKVPYLNGGLFEIEKDGLDEKGKVNISNESFTNVLELFERYNFTIDESTPFEVQVAVDPEMLGKVFEELVTGRHESGSYYTPRTVVSFMCREALKHALDGIETPEIITELVDDNNGTNVSNPEKVLERLRGLKICDPACGSGAYLLGMLQELLHVREALFASTSIAKDAQYKWKREIIENNIYGVDLDRFATQIAALRLWLSLAIESEEPHPLPNLKYKIGCGDSLLAPLETDLQPNLYRTELIKQFKEKKREYTDADNHITKSAAENEIEKIRAELAQMFDHGNLVNTFDWSVEFAEVFEDGGFDIILANPPYVQLQKMGAVADKYSAAGYETFARTGDIYCLFYELGQKILKCNGVVCYITSNKWMRAAYGEKTRRFFAEKTNPLILIDFAGFKIFDTATVDVNILVFSKENNQHKTLASVVKENVLDNLSVFVRQNCVTSSFGMDTSWVLLQPIEQQIKTKIEKLGTPLRDWEIEIYRGVLTGFNEAFIISGSKRNELIKADPKSAEIIRPVLRGRDVKKYDYFDANLWLINTHNGIREKRIPPVNIEDYPAIKKHLDQFYNKLEARQDQGITPYNLRNCAYIEDFSKQKIIYPNMTKYLPFYFDTEGFLTNQKCFIVTGKNIEYLTAFFNSSLFKYCFRESFPELLGGTRELSKVFLEKLPVRTVSNEENLGFKKLVFEIQKHKKTGKNSLELEVQIDEMIFDLYGLSREERNEIGFIEIR